MAAKEDSANTSVTNINHDSKVPAECVQNADKAKDTKDEASREEKTFSSRRSETRKQSVAGKFLRRSNQICKVSNNLTKLEGLHAEGYKKCIKGKSIRRANVCIETAFG